MALEVFSSIRYFLKPEDISIDNWIFKLHYRVSVALMLGSSAIGVAKQYFGDPINCQVSSFWVQHNIVYTYTTLFIPHNNENQIPSLPISSMKFICLFLWNSSTPILCYKWTMLCYLWLVNIRITWKLDKFVQTRNVWDVVYLTKNFFNMSQRSIQ